MKLTTILAWAFATVLSILIAVSAIAQCGGGATSGGCGTKAPAAAKGATQKTESKVVFSDAQVKKIAQIEKERDAKVKAVQPKFQKSRRDVVLLQKDPKVTDEALVKKIKEAMGYQAQMVAANTIAERHKDKVMTPAQAKQLAASQGSGGCGSSAGGGGCGSAAGGGGCGSAASSGSSAPKVAKPAQAGGGCGSSCGG